jgi:phage replication O-like protein O
VVLPHFKKGFTRIANEIAEALMRTNLSAQPSRIIWAIFRKTYGYQKTEDWISNSQFVKMTNMGKGNVSRALKKLIDRNMVTKTGGKLSFQEDSSKWDPLPKGVTPHKKLPGKVTKLPKEVPKSYQDRSTQKKERKYTKEREISKSFEKFYDAYPKKIGGKEALDQWRKLNPDEALQEEILEAIKKQRRTPGWQKEDGRFILSPAKWLAGERWNDQVPEEDGSW